MWAGRGPLPASRDEGGGPVAQLSWGSKNVFIERVESKQEGGGLENIRSLGESTHPWVHLGMGGCGAAFVECAQTSAPGLGGAHESGGNG